MPPKIAGCSHHRLPTIKAATGLNYLFGSVDAFRANARRNHALTPEEALKRYFYTITRTTNHPRYFKSSNRSPSLMLTSSKSKRPHAAPLLLGLGWGSTKREPLVHTRHRLNLGALFSRRPPMGQQRLCSPDGGNPLLYAWMTLCQQLHSRRHIEVTCGDSRAPMVGRCSRERRLIRSTGAPNGGVLTGFVAR
jgi:hypothetical protein